MEHKHTPGPWSYFEAEGGGSFIDHIDTEYVAHRVAFVYSDDAIEHIVTERNLADARLIAAAPDMLTALEILATGNTDPSRVVEIARAAIAKATGATHE